MFRLHPKLFKYVSISALTLAVLLNPFTIQYFFVRDGNITEIAKIQAICIVEIILAGISLVSYVTYRRWEKRLVTHLGMMMIGILACWLVFEIASWMAIRVFFRHDYYRFPKFSDEKIQSIHVYDEVEPNSEFGYALKKNFSIREQKRFATGQSIYDVVYTTDTYGRRVVGDVYEQGKKHLILFGCSFAFGEGLNDMDTLQYHLSQDLAGYNVYNYAVHGYGPQQMLVLLEHGRLANEVQSNEGVAIYDMVFPSAAERLVGSINTPWVYDFPYYAWEQDHLVEKGTFITNRTVLTYAYQELNILKGYSPLLQLLMVNAPITQKDIQLFVHVLERAKALYEQQFHGTFYVLLHPMSQHTKETADITKLLRAKNIPVLEYSLDDDARSYIIPGDGHPNGKINDELARFITTYLNSQNQ